MRVLLSVGRCAEQRQPTPKGAPFYNPISEFLTPEGCSILETYNESADDSMSIARARMALDAIVERYIIAEGCGRVEVGDFPPTDGGILRRVSIVYLRRMFCEPNKKESPGHGFSEDSSVPWLHAVWEADQNFLSRLRVSAASLAPLPGPRSISGLALWPNPPQLAR